MGVLSLTNMPQDILILICLHLSVEDLLALMQTCRVMHALGSLDYLWRRLLSDWDIPLDLSLNTSPASYPSNILRGAAVRALKLDNRWRDPRLEIHDAQPIISRDFSFVDGMRLLPGGRWLVTLQYEQSARTHLMLWSIEDLNNHHSMFKVTIVGRARSLQAYHHHELGQVTIGIVFARGGDESIRVYNVFLQGETLTRHSLVFEATSNELYPKGRLVGLKINGDIMIAVFTPLPSSSEHESRIVCVNLVSRATAVLECPDWSFAWSGLAIFRRHFAVVTAPQHTTANISFYELPTIVLGRQRSLSPRTPYWPESSVIKCSPIASTSWSSDAPLDFELSDGVPINTTEGCFFTMIARPKHNTRSVDFSKLGFGLLHVSFDGSNTECAHTHIPCRFIPSTGQIRVSSSGRRAVWLDLNPDTYGCTLVKFALGRRSKKEPGYRISTLMPSFSGLPFNPQDMHSFVFDEISCRMAVALPSGGLYILCC